MNNELKSIEKQLKYLSKRQDKNRKSLKISKGILTFLEAMTFISLFSVGLFSTISMTSSLYISAFLVSIYPISLMATDIIHTRTDLKIQEEFGILQKSRIDIINQNKEVNMMDKEQTKQKVNENEYLKHEDSMTKVKVYRKNKNK